MREIEFRGIDKNTNNFVFGNYIEKVHPSYEKPTFWGAFIHDKTIAMTEVIPETVGQYTGLKDKNGVKIFHDDIIKVKSKYGFNSDLIYEFKELKAINSINGIGLHFTGIVKIDLFRGLMFENPKNGYQEPIFTRHIDIKINHGEIEVIGNIHQNPELIL